MEPFNYGELNQEHANRGKEGNQIIYYPKKDTFEVIKIPLKLKARQQVYTRIAHIKQGHKIDVRINRVSQEQSISKQTGALQERIVFGGDKEVKQ